jgi:hypothetical protein
MIEAQNSYYPGQGLRSLNSHYNGLASRPAFSHHSGLGLRPLHQLKWLVAEALLQLHNFMERSLFIAITMI